MDLVIGRERTLLDALYLVVQNDMGEISKKVLKEDIVDVVVGCPALFVDEVRRWVSNGYGWKTSYL